MHRLVLCPGWTVAPSAGLAARADQRAARTGFCSPAASSTPARYCAAKETPWCLSSEDTAFVEQFFAALGGLGVFCAVIPGPAGEPLDEFFRLATEAELAFPNVHVVHATPTQEGDVVVCGLGGDISEEPLIGCECYTRVSATYFLRRNVAGRAAAESSPPPVAAAGATRRPGGERAGWRPDRQLPPQPVRGGRRHGTAGKPAGGGDARGQPRPPRGRLGGMAGLGAYGREHAGTRKPQGAGCHRPQPATRSGPVGRSVASRPPGRLAPVTVERKEGTVMFRTILVPLDGSPFAEQALPWALGIAAGPGHASTWCAATSCTR